MHNKQIDCDQLLIGKFWPIVVRKSLTDSLNFLIMQVADIQVYSC